VVWRLLLGMALAFVVFRVYRKIKESVSLERQESSHEIAEPDILVQDPVCGTFVPRKEALKMVQNGQEHFFCSEGCLKRFRRSGGK
jgi:uncharacterized protein